MKLLAFTDTHEDETMFPHLRELVKKEKVDLAVCAGDFTIMGGATHEMMRELNTLGVPVVFIHGNHEDEEEVRSLLPQFSNLHFAHETCVELLGWRFIGFGGHGFHERERDLQALEKKLADKFNHKTIIICHAPPYGVLDEVEEDWHVGNKDLHDLIGRRLPTLVLCGHIHEAFHERARILRTTIINPGPDGEIIEVHDG